MQRNLLASVEELISTDFLSDLENRSIAKVRCIPFDSVDSVSGSQLLRIETNDGDGPRYVLKRISPEWDWIMRATGDDRARAVVSWQTGLLDRLPSNVVHGVIACARDGNGWAILMRDVGAALIPPGDDVIEVSENECFLATMAAMHATFWNQPDAVDPALGFCALRHRYTELSPETGRREAERGSSATIPGLLLEGWGLLNTVVDPMVARVIHTLLEDPQPLCDVLRRFPQTVVHGNLKLGNLGLFREERSRVVILDWEVVGPAPPAVDLAWYLAVNSARLPVTKEEAILSYQHSLAERLGPRFDQSWWVPQLEIALLGGFLQLGWAKALGAVKGATEAIRGRERAELAWWAERVRVGAKHL